MTVPAELKRQIIVLCRNSKTRKLGFPSRWCPGQVISPESDLPFTESGAWCLVADVLEAGEELRPVALRNPPAGTGYVITTKLSDSKEIYIKLQMGNGCVLGRSFHYSAPSGGEEE